MIPIINFTNPMTVMVTLLLFVLITILGKQMKKRVVVGIMLGIFLAIIIGHAIEFGIAGSTGTIGSNALSALPICLAFDFVFIFISFLSYLWVDKIEAEYKNEKILNSTGIDWFWSKV